MNLRALMALLLAMTAFAGCIGDGDSDSDAASDDDHCADGHADADCPDNGMDGNMTDGMGHGNMTGNMTHDDGETPDTPANITLAITDANGTAVTSVLRGESLTFDVGNSTDADGDLEAASLTLRDSNSTRTFAVMSGGASTPVTVAFDFAGIVAIKVAAIDVQGGITNFNATLAVNDPQPGTEFTFTLPHDPTFLAADECTGHGVPVAGGVLDPSYWKIQKVTVAANATGIDATVVGGAANIAICDPDGNPISPNGDAMVSTNDGTAFNASLDYFVSIVSGYDAPSGTVINNAVTVDVLVRYG